MGIPGVPRGLIAALVAGAVLLAAPSLAAAAPYPVSYDFSKGVLAHLVVQQQCPLDQAEHLSMAADPVVAQDVLNSLDPNHAAPVPCTVVLPLVGAPLYTGPPR